MVLIEAYQSFFFVEMPNGRYSGHVPTTLVSVNTTASTPRIVAAMPEI